MLELKERLAGWYRLHAPGEWEALGVGGGRYFGQGLERAVHTFQERVGIPADGIAGPQTFGALGMQLPRLPRRVSFPRNEYPPTGANWGLQPWIVPQVEAVCLLFSLVASEGHGNSPPHRPRSDHRWGGAVDLSGAPRDLVDCNVWADRYRADPHRVGAVFRWVGGPAPDAEGREEGHDDHVHLSWYRLGPATTVFATPELRSGIRPADD